MRICIIGGLAGPNSIAGGVWRVATEHRELLSSAGHDVTLLGMWLGESAEIEDFEVLHVRTIFPGAGLRALFSVSARKRLANVMADADVVHIHLARDYVTTTAVYIAARLGKPIVAQTHGMYAPSTKRLVKAFDGLFRASLIARVNVWLSLTDREEEQLAAMGVDSAKIRRVPNAISDPVLAEPATRRRERHFSFISRLQSRKQPDVFARAALKILSDNPDATFTIAGPDQGLAAKVASILESAPPQAIEMPGPISDLDVLHELVSTTAVVLPSRGEVAPMIAIEAAATATPLILTEDCGIAPALKERSAALIVAPDDDEVAEAMQQLLDNPELRYELSRNIRRAYEELWSPHGLQIALERVYLDAESTRGAA